MAKPFELKLYIEEIALGSVIRKLREMPGVAKIDFDLGESVGGAERKQLQNAAAASSVEARHQAILQILAHGPAKLSNMARDLGIPGKAVTNSVAALKKAGAVVSAGHGLYQLRSAAKASKKIKRGPKGRAAPGTGPALLREALQGGAPMKTPQIRETLAKQGMSPKAVDGVIQRGKRDGIIRHGDEGYALTAKGEKMNGATPNG